MEGDAKALEERRKERMILLVQALEGSGVQGMSVAGSKKTSAAGRRSSTGLGKVGKVGWAVSVAVLGSVGVVMAAV